MTKKYDPSFGDPIDPDKNSDLDPKGFDLAAWISGVQPVRRRVTVYGRGDLQAEIDELSRAEALARGADRKRLEERLVELTAELQDSGVVFEIEGRTSTAVTTVAKALRDGGVPDEDIDLGLLAAQIVAPQVTLEQLRDLRAKREADVLRLASVAADANSRPVALDPRFLPAASD
ncbi:MAG TPA: hypothetical protein GXZ60_11330 [Intrasporangiaceae bacterium]|nr:hypothetical protein [Intrasporangiaceae bacterium]